ncbi:transmembrane protein 256 [Nomia melanderi]|uniref:transmembrane protein 256 n=1 Tax=Nomia melanderi TaxID=2448451 RepID=UPI001304193A|nr:transmembrane protein 256-like [Nomia melanderi]XP_031833580.1 transmembrane protein 256-like [Nomia melanderi]
MGYLEDMFSLAQVAGAATYALKSTGGILSAIIPAQKVIEKMSPPIPLWKLAAAAGPYVKLAALSGAAAVGLGAYGSHREYPEAESRSLDRRQVFETANRYHYIHTLAMLSLPFCRAPYLGAIFFMSGMIMFCGSCYYYAFTGDRNYRSITPVGGVCLIVGWLSMCI